MLGVKTAEHRAQLAHAIGRALRKRVVVRPQPYLPQQIIEVGMLSL